MTARSARAMASTLAMLALAACNQNGPGRAAITDRCITGGEKPEVCKCFADESSRRLDRAMFELIVLGAQGQDTVAEQRLRELGPESQGAFSTVVRGIIRGCGGEAYLVAG
jgi:hypothetical protein